MAQQHGAGEERGTVHVCSGEVSASHATPPHVALAARQTTPCGARGALMSSDLKDPPEAFVDVLIPR